MKINIVGGRGVMGRVHKPIFEQAGHDVIISGRTSSISPQEAAKQSDLTIIAVPIPVTEEVIKQVAPYCSAIMDFTSIKSFPIEAMLKYSNKDCEVAGLHPLYGEVNSIKNRTIIYCPTERTGAKCKEIIRSLRLAGGIIKEMEPQLHDLLVNGINQVARVELLQVFALLLEKLGINIEELYDISPPPTKILLDLIARQVDEKNDTLYQAIRDYNPNTKQIREYMLNNLKIISEEQKNIPERIRKLYGPYLIVAQNRAKMLLEQLFHNNF